MNIKRKAILNLKNSIGWRTSRKIIVFAVDDYGNIRIANRTARENLIKEGLCQDNNRFDQFDCLEDEDDLIQLYEALSSVKDSKGNHAVFTAFSVPVNIDFDRMIEEDFVTYRYEKLNDTFNKIPGYSNVYTLWLEGIDKHLIIPEFHGREHLNINNLMNALYRRDKEVLICFQNHCYGGFTKSNFHFNSYTSAYNFWNYSENEELIKTAIDGLGVFQEVFGVKAKCFNPPGSRAHKCLEMAISDYGIKYIDTDFVKKEHQGNGKYKYNLNYIGKTNIIDQTYLVRNCVFEPLPEDNIDWVSYCLKQIEIAFFWNKPAIISSHRVNFSGHIEPNVRSNGLYQLRLLLKKIISKWPEIEFISISELGHLIMEKNN